jgi:protocatechuate 3,4-dioxygenase beta subunit
MRAVLNRIPAAAVLAILVGAPATAQVLPPRDATPSSQQPAVGTGVISGTITMAGSTQPARKVRVSLSGAELRGGRTAVTDDRGEFSFTALPPGRYNLSANKPGHVSVTYGQRQPGRPGTPIQLSDGQKFRADLQIPKGSVITGIVLDENGEPTPQTSVRVMRVVTQNGRRTLQSSNGSSTDDRGIYRAYGLLPGDYVVCATPRNTSLGNIDRMRVELRALQASMLEVERVNVEQARAIADRITSMRAAMPEDPEDVTPGYAPVCYPGTVSPSAATPITLGIAEERSGVDFQLQLAPLARVEGMVVNSTGADVRQVNVTLTDTQQAALRISSISARADSDGRFRLMNVPPGQYLLAARATIQPPRQAAARGGGRGRGAAPPESRPQPTTVWGAAEITVDGRNLSNVMLSLQQGVAVSGQVTFDGSTPPPPDLTRIRVTMSPTVPSPFGGSASTRVEANGRFTIPSVAPGLYRLSASGASGWTVQSSVVGGQDALDFPFEVKGNQAIGGASIVFTDRQTELTGMVTDDKNQPAPEFTLVIFPADSRYWNGSTSRRMQSTRPATDGRYTFRNLPPGDYRLAPVYDLPPGAQTDPAFLQQLEATALRITLQPGEKKTQDMRVGGM